MYINSNVSKYVDLEHPNLNLRDAYCRSWSSCDVAWFRQKLDMIGIVTSARYVNRRTPDSSIVSAKYPSSPAAPPLRGGGLLINPSLIFDALVEMPVDTSGSW